MKIKSSLLVLVAALTALVACQKPTPELDPQVDLEQKELNFSAQGGNQTVSFVSTRSWAFKGAPDWVVFEPEKGDASEKTQTVTVSVLANTGKNRECQITLSGGIVKDYLTIRQEGPSGDGIIGDGSKENPYAASSANILGAELKDGDNTTLQDKYVKGKISAITNVDTSFGNAEYYISDDGSTTDQFYIYRGYSLGGNKFKSESEIKVGDEVIVLGTIVNFKGNTVEMTTGSKIVSLNGETDDGGGSGPIEPITGTNLLENGSFETWTGSKPQAWDFTNGNATLTKVADAKDGSNACEVSGDATGENNLRLMSRPYTLTTGTYQIQLFVKGEGQYRVGYAVCVNGKVSGSNAYFYLDDGTPVQAGSDWAQYVVQFTLTEQTQISLSIMNSKKGKGKTIIVDDVKLVTNDGGVDDGGDTPLPVEDATVSQVISDQKTDVRYRLTGTVSNFNSKYCSFDLTDATGTIYVYSVDSETKDTYSTKLQNGDTVTLEGDYQFYEKDSKHEIVNAKITAWTEGEGGDEPTPAVISVASSKSVAVGSTVNLNASVNSGATLSYTSDNEDVATVSSTGVVTGVSEGTATISITAPAKDNYTEASATCTITVTNGGVTPTGGKFVKVTSDSQITAGKYLIVWDNGAHAVIGKTNPEATGDPKDLVKACDVTISGNEIAYTSELDAATVIFAEEEGGFSIQLPSGKYLSCNANSNQAVELKNPFTFTKISAANGISGVDTGSNQRYLYKNSSNEIPNYRFYKSQSSDKYAVCTLYKYQD